jgi:hypothetical protein
MIQLQVDPNIKIYVGSDATVLPANEFTPGAPKDAPKVQKTADNGDFLWTIKDVEVISAFGISKSNLTIVSKTVPVISARTEYGVTGTLVATVQSEVKEGFNGGKARSVETVSYKLTGALKSAQAFPNKD